MAPTIKGASGVAHVSQAVRAIEGAPDGAPVSDESNLAGTETGIASASQAVSTIEAVSDVAPVPNESHLTGIETRIARISGASQAVSTIDGSPNVALVSDESRLEVARVSYELRFTRIETDIANLRR